MASSLAIESRLLRERKRSFAIAMLNEPDFYRLKSERADLRLPDHYADWLDERDGLLIGLSAAGMRAVYVTIELDKLLTWCAAGSIPLDEAALDRFAASVQGAQGARDFALIAERAFRIASPRFESFN